MWLILGGNGQLGRCLDEVLTAERIDHLCIDRTALDITHESALLEAVMALSPSVVVNAAAWTAVDDAEDHEREAMRINGHGAGYVAHAAHAVDARLFHVSTDYVFDGLASFPYTVESPTAPIGAYGRTKLAGERFVVDAGLDKWNIVRTAWLYSRHGRNFAKTMALRAIRGDTVRVVDDQRGQPTSALDLARLMVSVESANAPSGIIHGTNAGDATWYQFAKAIYECAGVDSTLVTPTDSSAYPTKAIRPRYSVLDHGSFTRFGVPAMRHWEDALRDAMPGIVARVREESQA